jgi:DNA-binding NarL/FixJ family response regulator
VRLIVADDSLLFREGLVRLLAEQGFEIVGQTDNPDDLVRRVGGLRPEVAIVDIRMPPSFTDEGLRAALQIEQKHPEVGVLVLSQYVEATYAMRLLAHGSAGRGYLLKDRVSDLNGFADAIRRVGGGGSVVDPEVVAALVGRRQSSAVLGELTDRERQILELMAEGRSNAGIAEAMVVTAGAVEKHTQRIFAKLGLRPDDDTAHRRVSAVVRYLRSSG